MKNYSENEIAKLQDNLLLIRKAGGWSAEEFGDMIGVTKQTISNLENKKTIMTKTQYIAIRAVLDYEMSELPEGSTLAYTVNLCLSSDDLSSEDIVKAQAFVDGASKKGLDSAVVISCLSALIGITTEVLKLRLNKTSVTAPWLTKLMKGK